MAFAHVFSAGKTFCGKSFRLKEIFKMLRNDYKQLTIAFNPMSDPAIEKIVTINCKTIDELEKVISDPTVQKCSPHLWIDEAVRFYKDVKSRHENCLALLTDGRHKGITVYMATQKPVKIDPDHRGMFSEAIIFRLGSRRDATAIEEIFGEFTFNGIDFKEIALNLPTYHCLFLKQLEGGDLLIEFKDPDFVTIASETKVPKKLF